MNKVAVQVERVPRLGCYDIGSTGPGQAGRALPLDSFSGGLTRGARVAILDKRVSVSALVEVEDSARSRRQMARDEVSSLPQWLVRVMHGTS